jgi:adenylyltransferase/sulfurtransferase
VLGILPGTIGLIEATEILKIILGIGSTLSGKLLIYDALETRFQELIVRKNPECAACSHPASIQYADYDTPACSFRS